MPQIVLGETIVRVDWEDAWSNGDYWTLDEISDAQPFLAILVGTVIRNDKAGVTVARETFPSSEYGELRFRDVHHVPRKMIRKVTIVK